MTARRPFPGRERRPTGRGPSTGAALVGLVLLLVARAPASAEIVDLARYWPNAARMGTHYLESPQLQWGFVPYNGDAVFGLTEVRGASAFCLEDDFMWLQPSAEFPEGRLGLFRNVASCDGAAKARAFSPPLMGVPRFYETGTTWRATGSSAFLDTTDGRPVRTGTTWYEMIITTQVVTGWGRTLLLWSRVWDSDEQYLEEIMWAVDDLPVCGEPGRVEPGLRRYANNRGIDTLFSCWKRR